MRNFLLITVLACGASLVACQKQQTEEERKAEVERQVQERVAAEHQQQQAQDLATREADVNAREQALKEKQQAEAGASAQTPPQPQITLEAANETQSGNSYSMFYARLEPYGDWIETDDYGYIFRPRQTDNNRWRPYTNGHWVYTDAGWTWVSDEPFGWATYHYGRWTRLRGVGWVWVPGDEWAAAWVSWRKGGQYVGWAPLPPEAHFDRASGIGNWSDNYYDVGPDQYVFVPITNLGEQRVERVIIPEQQNLTVVTQTTNVTNITYKKTVIVNEGPSYDEMRAQSRAPIQRLKLQRETTLPAQNAHAVVRGDIVSIPAPSIKPALPTDRPRTVKQTIKATEVDRGWSGASDQRQAEQARAKMKTEATPPSNAPPKKFVKPAAGSNAARVPVATSTTAAAAPRSSQTPAVPPARTTMTPDRPPTATPSPSVTATMSPDSMASPSATFSITAAPARKKFSPEPFTRSAPSLAPEAARSDQSPRQTAIARATPSISPQTPRQNEERQSEKKKNLPRRATPEISQTPQP